ncbi:YncE family protein [Rhizobacter sp. OV335]|uniref:YncE family protein n=1 Tax=Rhizobacter sp. OV335 TaxID=1500264 RepID=UPI0009181AD9|nr:hypothetical protein [Rhizobacter sp. OV335]SHN16136.1 hypothetical protein SAMN02787076_03720 [Rhizobacter sp. OV335]
MTRRPFLASALAVLLISLSACGGGGDEAGNSSGNDGTKVLFVPDKAHAVVGALSTLSPAVGSVKIDTFAFGAFSGDNLQYDPVRDELYGATLAAAQVSISVYGSASRGSAGAALVRSFKLPADVVRANWLTLDRATGTLYISTNRQADNTLLVYKNAATLTGTPTPDRNQAFNGLLQPTFDFTRGIIYAGQSRLALATGQQIATLPALPVGGTSIAIDSQRDVLYLANSTDNTLRVITQASTANAAIVATLPVPNIQYVTVDPANNRLYVSVLATAFVFENASTISGNAATASTITSAGSTLGGVAFR